MKQENCPNCGSPKFGYVPGYKTYTCRNCNFTDRERLIPEEIAGYASFQKYMRKLKKDKLENECDECKSCVESIDSYSQFKKHMNQYIKEETPKAKRGRKPKNAESEVGK